MLLKHRDNHAIDLTLSLDQIKTIYRALFLQLRAADAEEFDALDEGDMLMTLQRFLQQRAADAGVDVADHSAWDRFIGVRNAPGCAKRAADRGRPA
ncbi:MAG: hypothetical protein IPM64_15330 [Phycisphaerales bacterium]|nr:hypothetical protein [Phycisphaerales bacterium]